MIPSADIDVVTQDGRTLDQLASSKHIRARLRRARQVKKRRSHSSSDASDRTRQSASSSITNNDVNDDGFTMSVDFIESGQLANSGISHKNLQFLAKKLDFINVNKDYEEIYQNFEADNRT